jgi:single-strand DNA-binding protein
MLNEAQLIGRVGKDPEVRTMQDGKTIVNLTIATTEKWSDKQTGERKEQTEWHRVSAFGKLADIIARYVTKGSLIFVRGSIHTREYEKDGIKRYATEIRAETMKMLGGGSKPEPQQAYQPPPSQDEESLPF